MHLDYNINLYLSEGLPSRTETRLRSHLRECDRCRSFYDQQVRVHRALAGNPNAPTPQEEERLVRLVLQKAGLELPGQPVEESPGLTSRILWAPAPALAAALLLLVLVISGSALLLLSTSPGEPVVAAQIIKAHNLEMDGRHVDSQTSGALAIHAGVNLEVGRGGFAELSLERGGSVRVFPESSLTLSGPGEELQLIRGKIWCLVDPVDMPFFMPFTVKTDVVEVWVLGTSFVVEQRAPNETQVRVAKGVVEVRDIKTGETMRIQGCYEARIVSGGSPPSPGRYSPKRDRSDWNTVLDQLQNPH